jgi:RNA polymerase sigma-70 factor (ECF subfamily)
MAESNGGGSGILARVTRRDHLAFTRLVEAHDADMARLCFVICGNLELARDATQNAWQRLWRDPPRLNDESRLRSWLLTVAANEARQLARRRRRGAILEHRSARSEPAPRPDLGIERVDLERALARISPDERELLGLRYLLGMSSPEIATQLGLSAEGVRTRLRRLLARLRVEMDR